MPSLRIEIGGQVVVAHLGDVAVRVGRDPACDLRIDDSSISAVHLSIEPLPGGGHKLTDANTGRPTRVNGLVVKRVSLKSGDLIEVGPARITYLADGGAVAPARPAAVPSAAAAPVAPPPLPPSPPPAPLPAPLPVPGPAPAAAPAVPAAPAAAARVPSEVAAAAVSGPSEPRPPAAPVPAAPSRPTHRLRAALLLAGGFAVAAIVVAALVRSGGDEALDLKALRLRLDAAKALAATDVDGAIQALDGLTHAPVEGVRRDAEREAAYLRKRLEQAASDVADLERRAPRFEAGRAASEVAALDEKYGPAIAKKHAGLLDRLEASRRASLEDRSRAAQAKAESLCAEGHFVEAVGTWETFAAEAPGGDETRRLVEDGRAAVEARAAEGLRDLVTRATEVAQSAGPRAAASLLRERLHDFAGTAAAATLARHASELDRAAEAAPAAAPVAAPTPGAAPHVPEGATPPVVPSPTGADRARIAGLLADADAKAGARRFQDALAALDEAAKAAAGTADAARIAARREDVDAARAGLDLLGRAIREHPDRFADVEIAPKYSASLVDADDEFVTAAVRGGRTKVRWTSFDAAKMAALVEAARVPGRDVLPLAALLWECGGREAAEKALFRAASEGGDKAAVDARLARWRGEAVPAGGYVAYEGRLVTPAERERLVLEARIAAAVAKVQSHDPRERRAAYDEMLGLGAPAKDAFAKALRARRDAVAHEIAAMKVFTAGKTRQRLLQELEKRREAALALIEDEKAYPYPYPAEGDHPGQAEVDRLVDLVREAWQRPFDLVASWDKGVEEALAQVREVDEVLARVEEGYAPDMDAVKAVANAAVDVPALATDPADRDVLAYDERVATTATGQEKENVRAVNAYRLMMGRHALKIDERLVRAARGHSIEMRVKDYFAHESPTPGLETPGKRVAREGYSGSVGENIAKGTRTAHEAFDGWFHSSGHHRNMLGKGWTEMGVGRSGLVLWTQVFGGLTGRSLNEPAALPPPGPDVAPEPADDDKEVGPPPPEKPGKPGKPGKDKTGKPGKRDVK